MVDLEETQRQLRHNKLNDVIERVLGGSRVAIVLGHLLTLLKIRFIAIFTTEIHSQINKL